jgi:hypothetical protein
MRDCLRGICICGMLGAVTLAQATIYGALIAAGSAIIGFIVALAGNLVIERRRDRRAAVQLRDQAIAELLVSVVDLVSGVQAVRIAYQGKGGWRGRVRKAAVTLSAVGLVMPGNPGDPMPKTRDEWSAVLDWRTLPAGLDRLLDEVWHLDEEQRLVALDLATILLPRTSRFYSAVAVLTLGPDKEIAAAVRRLTPAVGGLMEAIASRKRKYERARRRAQRALGKFRDVADEQR